MKKKEKSAMAGFLCMAAVLLFASGVVWAQSSPMEIDNGQALGGIFIGVAPDYVGSSDYKAVAAPFFRYNFSHSEQYILLRGFELQANVVDHPWFRIGPVLNYRFGRNNVENDQVDRMEEIDGAIEAGAFVGAEFKDSGNPRQRVMLSLEFLQDISGEHKGNLTTGSIKGWLPLSSRFDATLGLSTSFGSSDFMETYFGVDAADSNRSGLRRFSASSGFRDVSITPGLLMRLTESWYLAGGVRYMRLVGDAEDSPVTKVGDANQWIVGVGAAYSW
jgi:outer membrane protein